MIVSNQRVLCNQTNMRMRITLYVQAGNDIKSQYGTVVVELASGEMQEVEFGNLRNNTLSGVRINPLPWDPADTYYAQVVRRDDPVDRWLNCFDHIEISIELLQRLLSHRDDRRAGPVAG